MVRVSLLLIIAGGAVIFALQNLSPIALVVLGLKTQALPLSVWVLGAMTAGALTTLVLNGFSSISKSFAVRRSTQRPTDPTAKSPKSPWSGMGMKSGENSSNRTARGQNAAGFRAARSEDRRNAEDWDTPRSNDWDDWGEPATPRRSPTPSPTPTRDTNNEDWARWDDYEQSGRETRRSPQPDPARRIDLGPHPSSRSTSAKEDSYRGGSQETTRKANEVYDAEYRVIIPPYNPTPEPPVPPTSSASDDEDWGLDDDLEDKTDRSR